MFVVVFLLLLLSLSLSPPPPSPHPSASLSVSFSLSGIQSRESSSFAKLLSEKAFVCEMLKGEKDGVGAFAVLDSFSVGESRSWFTAEPGSGAQCYAFGEIDSGCLVRLIGVFGEIDWGVW